MRQMKLNLVVKPKLDTATQVFELICNGLFNKKDLYRWLKAREKKIADAASLKGYNEGFKQGKSSRRSPIPDNY